MYAAYLYIGIMLRQKRGPPRAQAATLAAAPSAAPTEKRAGPKQTPQTPFEATGNSGETTIYAVDYIRNMRFVCRASGSTRWFGRATLSRKRRGGPWTTSATVPSKTWSMSRSGLLKIKKPQSVAKKCCGSVSVLARRRRWRLLFALGIVG